MFHYVLSSILNSNFLKLKQYWELISLVNCIYFPISADTGPKYWRRYKSLVVSVVLVWRQTYGKQ